MVINNNMFNTKEEHHIIGILNLTPDSFSDGGEYTDLERAISHVEEMITQGASIIDVGGMSTRPGYEEISVEEEIERVLPVLKAIDERFDVTVSIDTYRSEVVEKVAPYIHMVNDVTGLLGDFRMAEIIAKYELSVCIMAHKAHVINENELTDTGSLQMESNMYMKCIKAELEESINIALKAGIPKNKIMIDGGVGFGKDYVLNLTVIHHTNELVQMGYPVLIATSNKGFMREVTGNTDKNKSHETVTTTIMGAINGATFFRVHDVLANKRALDMYKAINSKEMP